MLTAVKCPTCRCLLTPLAWASAWRSELVTRQASLSVGFQRERFQGYAGGFVAGGTQFATIAQAEQLSRYRQRIGELEGRVARLEAMLAELQAAAAR